MAKNSRTNTNPLHGQFGNSFFANLVRSGYPCFHLSEQYRMVPQLAALLRSCSVYDEEMTNGFGTDVESRPVASEFQKFLQKHYGLEGKSLMVVNFTGTPSASEGDSPIDRACAERVWTVIKDMLADGFKGEDIAVIVPNSARKHLHHTVKRTLAQSCGKAKEITLSTFDECAGSEASVVILDLVISKNDYAIDFSRAISTARDGMIIIGDFTIAENQRRDVAYPKIFKHARDTGCLGS